MPIYHIERVILENGELFYDEEQAKAIKPINTFLNVFFIIPICFDKELAKVIKDKSRRDDSTIDNNATTAQKVLHPL